MAKKTEPEIEIPSWHNWRTSDEDEINRRRLRARTEEFRISNLAPRHPVLSNFRVVSGSGLTYSVEIRNIGERQFSCECVDFQINNLGTCKHVEAVLLYLEARSRRRRLTAGKTGKSRLDIVPDATTGSLRLLNGHGPLPVQLKRWFGPNGILINKDPAAALSALKTLADGQLPELRLSQDIAPWVQSGQRAMERKELRRQYEQKVQSGEWPPQETKTPLFPYQREGMLHLAFTERALLADEMGLGKTIQAIAACALLHRLGKAARVLVVAPASLKTEWEEQIQQFTDLSFRLVYGNRAARLSVYENPHFFTIVNYEQMLVDALDVNARLRPDIIVLDEAQRIKNWSAKTTQAIKRLQSRYAFVLTGTPVENRIDELFSLMSFLQPAALGPLFRFNRDYYQLDDRGRPNGYKNLAQLHERIRPYLLRRRKSDVETELPERTDRNFFVPLSPEQKADYEEYESVVSRLANTARRRPLTQPEQERLLRFLAMMRMVCDTSCILNPERRACPKLVELEKLIEECRENPDVKIIIFSEWERMLDLVRGVCRRIKMGFAWHTGSVPQKRRRAEINAFKSDPDCRVFLSTDSGATGLNLQNASVVINCDLPWNPAKLEQRIARAWRKHQSRPVTVINLVSENTIEHRMLETLANKQALADGVLELKGNLDGIKFGSGRQAFLAKLEQLVTAPGTQPIPASPSKATLPVDRPAGFAAVAHRLLNGALVRCEERFPAEGIHSVLFVVVDRDARQYREKLKTLHAEYFRGTDNDTLSSVRLEVIDRATDDALQRFIELGLVSRATRAIRPLFTGECGPNPPAISEAELKLVTGHRESAARKLRLGKLLSEGQLEEEARTAILDSLLPLGRALAIENRLPEPTSVKEALHGPLEHCWGEPLQSLRQFAAEAAAPCDKAMSAIQAIIASKQVCPTLSQRQSLPGF
jgi:hypothetical protein